MSAGHGRCRHLTRHQFALQVPTTEPSAPYGERPQLGRATQQLSISSPIRRAGGAVLFQSRRLL